MLNRAVLSVCAYERATSPPQTLSLYCQPRWWTSKRTWCRTCCSRALSSRASRRNSQQEQTPRAKQAAPRQERAGGGGGRKGGRQTPCARAQARKRAILSRGVSMIFCALKKSKDSFIEFSCLHGFGLHGVHGAVRVGQGASSPRSLRLDELGRLLDARVQRAHPLRKVEGLRTMRC